MKTVWKVLLGLALVVPVGAYVAGSLAASASSDPAPRQTIEIQAPDPTPPGPPSGTPPHEATPSATPGRGASDDVEVITPWDDVDDHGGDGHDGHRGHGGDDGGGHDHGGPDRSGHGGED